MVKTGDLEAMKEKLNAYIFSWRFPLHLNILFMLIHIVSMIIDFQIGYLAGASFHFGIAIMTWIIIQYDKEHKKDAELIHALDYLLAKLIKESKRLEREAESEKQDSENLENEK